MRELQEIKKDIEEVDVKIHLHQVQRQALLIEKAERTFFDFCEKYGVKKGDIVRNKRFGDVVIVGINDKYDIWIVCRRIKKNGEPYINVTEHTMTSFNDCEVIGHREDWI